ncbi:MAG: TrmJ/YjtD family RNA methyltransferase [Thermodesulfobacteriota bacterium]|nr:TrmJ/YjtD family RNA methyltransferase [Thermodesulfobacteriota bacterium]
MPQNQHLLDNIAIILLNPKYPENIGSAARAAWNMGISRIIVVAKEYPDHDQMAKLATHNALALIDTMEFHEYLEDALKPFSQVIGTTARRGRHRLPGNSPRDVMKKILPLLPANQVAFLFGPEDRGLTNDDLKYCQFRSAIPTADFSSLNLAQAVAIHCYEIFHTVVHEQKDIRPAPKIATSHEIENMYAYMEDSLSQIDFLQDKSHTYYMRNIRQFFSRIRLESRETNLIRSICRQFLKHES